MQNPENARKKAISGRFRFLALCEIPKVISKTGKRISGGFMMLFSAENKIMNALIFSTALIDFCTLMFSASAVFSL